MTEMNKLQIQLPVKRAAASQNKNSAARSQSDRQDDSFGRVMEDTVSGADTKNTKEVKGSKDTKEVKDSKEAKADESAPNGENKKPEENTAAILGAPAVAVQDLCIEASVAVRQEIQPLTAEEQTLPVETAISTAEKQAGMTGPQTAILAGEQAVTKRPLEAGITAGKETARGETKQPAGMENVSELKAAVKADNVRSQGTGEATVKSAGEAAADATVEVTAKTTAEDAGTEASTAADTKAAETTQVKQPEKEADKLDIRALQQMTKEPGTPQLQGEEPIRIKVAEPFNRMDENLTKQLGEQVTKNLEQGKQELNIQLEPEHLGKISIKISVLNEEIRVLVSCDNQKTLGLLAERSDGIGRIIENNMKSPVVVEVKEDNAFSQQKNATDQHENRNGSQQEPKHDNHKEESDGFLQQMRLGIFEDRMAAG